MKKKNFRIQLKLHDRIKDTAEKERLRIDLAPSMTEWHIRDLRMMNGFR
ncbi:MAG: hypothetical protein KBA87_00950 [Lachnospiraceae bacterium]|jgi:hypothetical protein|nr:hypothetical protein [Lachnospiraceae bacterium]